MQADARRAIAYIAARLALGDEVSEIYEPETRIGHIYAGDIRRDLIRVYDYARSCQIVGRNGALYDSAQRAAIQLCVGGRTFYGYDYDAHRAFDGVVLEASVRVRDAAVEGCFVYQLQRALFGQSLEGGHSRADDRAAAPGGHLQDARGEG